MKDAPPLLVLIVLYQKKRGLPRRGIKETWKSGNFQVLIICKAMGIKNRSPVKRPISG
jgi:hypothetical protein